MFEKLYRRVFGLHGQCSWDVNNVGYQVWDESVTERQQAYYIHGGVSSYKKSVLIEHPFAVFGGGRTGLEDVEHCLRLKQAGFHVVYEPAARLTHHPALAGREGRYEAAKKEGINRKEIYKKYGNKSTFGKLHFAWASVGWIGKKILSLNISAVIGLLSGYFSFRK